MRSRDYDYWLSMLKIWTTARQVPIPGWSVQYDDQPARPNDPDWRRWMHQAATLRRLTVQAEVPWDDAACLF